MGGRQTNDVYIRLGFTSEQHEQLKLIKETTGVPVNESVRRAVDLYLETQRVKAVKSD